MEKHPGRVVDGFHLLWSEWNALDSALHMEKVIGAAHSPGRQNRLATWRRLDRRGLVTEIWCPKVDGDGFLIEPERYGIAFQLTDEGRRLALLVKAQQAEEDRLARLCSLCELDPCRCAALDFADEGG